MESLVFDLEANGLMDATKLHCIVIEDRGSGIIQQYYGEKDIYLALGRLYYADEIIGHNICGFDIPLIQKLYPAWHHSNPIDTLVCSYLISPERRLHSLDSYAKSSEYDKVPIDDWSCLTYEMLDRCTLDVMLNTELYQKMWDKELHTGQWDNARILEQKVAAIHTEQVQRGVLVDQFKVLETILKLDNEMWPLAWEIEKDAPLTIKKGGTINKVFKKDGSYMAYVDKFIKEVS